MSHARIRRYLKHGTLPQIAVFEAIARLGSYTRAAAELHLAQPTVSTQVKKLTDTVGLPLFEQVGKRVYLTDAGRTLYAACTEVYAALTRMEQSCAELRGVTAGRLALAAGTSASFIPELLARFARRYPGIDISLTFGNHDALCRRLADNADDLYMFATPPAHEVVKQAYAPNPLVACARVDHPLARERGIPFARLLQERFVLREPGSGTRLAAEQLFERAGGWPQAHMELPSDAAICLALRAGTAVAIVSQHVLAAANGVVMLDVDGLPLTRQWYFVYPGGKRLSHAAQALIALARTPAHEPSATPDVERICSDTAATQAL